MDYLCNCKSEISNLCNVAGGHCLQAIKIVHHHPNGSFDWLISGQQSVDPSREAISILSEKYKRFMFVHPGTPIMKSKNFLSLKTHLIYLQNPGGKCSNSILQSVSWSLAEFRHNKIVQSPHENYFNVCRQHKEK